jgi:hypothetical protein
MPTSIPDEEFPVPNNATNMVDDMGGSCVLKNAPGTPTRPLINPGIVAELLDR